MIIRTLWVAAALALASCSSPPPPEPAAAECEAQPDTLKDGGIGGTGAKPEERPEGCNP